MASPFTLVNRHGERLAHSFTPGPEGGREIVVLAHGVTSDHDRPYLNALAAALAGRGVAALQVTFAGNGASEGRFEDCTVSKEVEDLGSVLDALDGWTVGYAGHSMGAAVGVLRAARDARVRALVSLAGMVRVDAFVRRVFGDLRPGEPMLGRERCPLSPALLEDARRIGDTLDAAREVAVPWLLVHGTADELVPHRDAVDARAANPAAELVTLEGADHRFEGQHAELVAAVAPWLATRLGV